MNQELQEMQLQQIELQNVLKTLSEVKGKHARLIVAVEEFRDSVLNGRYNLEGVLDNDQTNAVLSLFDDTIAQPDAAGISDINPGDQVIKDKGDYRFEGIVLSVMVKKSGAVRYAVENEVGMIHIFSRNQLTPVQ